MSHSKCLTQNALKLSQSKCLIQNVSLKLSESKYLTQKPGGHPVVGGFLFPHTQHYAKKVLLQSGTKIMMVPLVSLVWRTTTFAPTLYF